MNFVGPSLHCTLIILSMRGLRGGLGGADPPKKINFLKN